MSKASIVKLFLIFIAVFVPVLGAWIIFKDYYNFFVTDTMFELSARHYDLIVTDATIKGHDVVFELKNAIPLRDLHGKSHDFDLQTSIDMEAVTFNIPMTLSLLIAIVSMARLPWKRKWEIFYVGFLLLFMLHLGSMLLFSLCTIAHIAKANPYIHFYLSRHALAGEFICSIKDFLINYAARFEPFLIALFAWVEVHRKGLSEPKEVSPPSTPKSRA